MRLRILFYIVSFLFIGAVKLSYSGDKIFNSKREDLRLFPFNIKDKNGLTSYEVSKSIRQELESLSVVDVRKEFFYFLKIKDYYSLSLLYVASARSNFCEEMIALSIKAINSDPERNFYIHYGILCLISFDNSFFQFYSKKLLLKSFLEKSKDKPLKKTVAFPNIRYSILQWFQG